MTFAIHILDTRQAMSIALVYNSRTCFEPRQEPSLAQPLGSAPRFCSRGSMDNAVCRPLPLLFARCFHRFGLRTFQFDVDLLLRCNQSNSRRDFCFNLHLRIFFFHCHIHLLRGRKPIGE